MSDIPVIPGPRPNRSSFEEIDLSGGWQLRWRDPAQPPLDSLDAGWDDPKTSIAAQVPGEAHLDLLRHGLIEDPYVGSNILSARWVEECVFTYRREFHVPADAVDARAWLVFDGLDLAACVFLNGVEIATHHNAFYPCRIDVTGKLREGSNVVIVLLESGIYQTLGHGDDMGRAHRHGTPLVQRQCLRKAQFQFGWDFSPRLLNVGIHGAVRLEWTRDPVRLDQLVAFAHVSEDYQTGRVVARLFIEGLQGDGHAPIPAELAVEMVDTGDTATMHVEIQPGLHPYQVEVLVDEPQLWWPAGHGKQILYWLRVALHVSDGTSTRPAGEKTVRVGFRHVRIDQDSHPLGGASFALEINSRRIFAKGANWLPFDIILPAQDLPRMKNLIDLAIGARLNFLRLPGYAGYGADEFYQLCDQRGIMVWQDFPFSNAEYPVADAAFLEDVKAEVVHNVRRLAWRPSLIAWCGNNEHDLDAWARESSDGPAPAPDYALYHDTLPRILLREDPDRHYQPTSPYARRPFAPNSDEIGDQHVWLGGRGNQDFRGYRDLPSRFPLEGGLLGPTSLPTMEACLPDAQRSIHSLSWDIHDNALGQDYSDGGADAIFRENLGLNAPSLSLEDIAYYGGLLQGEALREFCDNFRRRMFTSGGMAFSTFNDVWPATRSWGIVDYYLRRTPAYWAVRAALSPVHLVIAREGDAVTIYGINEGSKPFVADLRFGLFNLVGGFPMNRLIRVSLSPRVASPLATYPAEKWKERDVAIAFALLMRHEKIVARNRLFLSRFRQMQWAPADVRVKVDKGEAVFECDSFAWGVCIDMTGEVALPDNFFDVWPSVPHAISWPNPEPPKVLRVGNLSSTTALARVT